MRPGPTRISRCPHCSGLVAQTTLASRGRHSHPQPLWTDGQPSTEPWTIHTTGHVCGHCRGWIHPWDLEEVGSAPSWEDFQVRYPQARHHAEPTVDELVARASSGLTPFEERDLRLRAWWQANDQRRTAADPFEVPRASRRRGDSPPLPPAEDQAPAAPRDPGPPLLEVEADNAHALLVLMGGPYTQDLVVRAEIMRHFGRFEEARELASRLGGHGVDDLQALMLRLIEIGDRHVRLVPTD